MTELADLSPEQQAVVESWGQGLAVMAGAGAGKTTTLVIKCAELLKRNPEARFAAVSFTERSASDLRAKLTARLTRLTEAGVLPVQPGQAGVLSRHWVMTIHGLCSAVIREYPREAGFDGEETMLSEPETALLWSRSIEALWFEEDLPEEVQSGLDFLLERESRDSLAGLLARTRELFAFGVLDFLDRADDRASQALSVLSAYVMERYDRLKRRRGAMDFNDLERGADRALEHAHVREAFQKRFDLVMVDEFQDTNPLQARIILRFVRPDVSNLVVVGDPKQSIYRFRDADVSVFDDFCSRMPVNKQLTWNFRSRPGIIDYTNELCARAFEASEMRYDALVPKREAGSVEPVVRLDVTSPSDLAAWIRGEMGRGVALHDMALLLRKIRGNEKWLKALTSFGIPIAVGSGGLFWGDPRARELVAFLKWWDNPGNSFSGAVFLRAPWMGVSDLVLDQWVKQDPTWVRPFFASDHPVAVALRGLRGRIVRPGELLMALLVDESVEMELGAPLLGLWHRLEELSSRGLDFHAAVSEVASACEAERRERDVPPPRNQGQLSVLTLHGSKGLEFPHVILIDLGKKGRGSDMPLLFWDRVDGAYLGGRDADGERDKKNPYEVRWREQEKRKNLAESMRVFYVALTRAQERLVLVCPELDKPVETETPFADDFWRAWVEAAGTEVPRQELGASHQAVSCAGSDALSTGSEPHSRVQATSGVGSSAVFTGSASNLHIRVTSDVGSNGGASHSSLRPPGLRSVRPRHSVTEWNLLSRCERAYEWTYVRPMPVQEGIEEMGLFTGMAMATREQDEMTQRELGTRVHGCLERGDFDGLRDLEREVGSDRFVAEPVISWAMSSEWMAPARAGEGREVWTELAFEIPVRSAKGEGEILVGSLDRLVADRAGGTPRYSIIDFKVTEKAKSVEALLEAYQAQMELYALGLRQLEPGATDVQALLVNISAQTIQAMLVPLGQLKVDALATRASEIVNGRAGKPIVGELCRFCDFRAQCPEGRKAAKSMKVAR